MARENYRKLMTENAKSNFISVLALSDNQLKGFKRFCKRNDTPQAMTEKIIFSFIAVYMAIIWTL